MDKAIPYPEKSAAAVSKNLQQSSCHLIAHSELKMQSRQNLTSEILAGFASFSFSPYGHNFGLIFPALESFPQYQYQ